MSYQISFDYRFESAHRFMHSCEDSCSTPHGHTWWAKLILETNSPMPLSPETDMVAEFSKLKTLWKTFITEIVDHSFLHNHQDPIVDAMRSNIPKFRGLPFPGDPTTELISALFLCKAQKMLTHFQPDLALGHIRIAAVHIQETPTNGVTYRMPNSDTPPLWESKAYRNFNGWWLDPNPESRSISQSNIL